MLNRDDQAAVDAGMKAIGEYKHVMYSSLDWSRVVAGLLKVILNLQTKK